MIHINKDKIRLLEGYINNDALIITKAAEITDCERFFEKERLTRLSPLVKTVCELLAERFTTRNLHIVYDNKLAVDFNFDDNLIGKRRDLGKFFGQMNNEQKGRGDKSDKVRMRNDGVITHSKKWGLFITEDIKGELTTQTSISKDLSDCLISEFGKYNYKVLSIDVPENTIFYLRNSSTYTFDSMNKLIIYANNEEEGTFFETTKDMPSQVKNFHFGNGGRDTFIDNCLAMIGDEIEKSHLHLPYIILVGDAFADVEKYRELCDAIQAQGYLVHDIYRTWGKEGYLNKQITTYILQTKKKKQSASKNGEINVEIEGPIVLNGSYGLCLAGLFRLIENKPENMMEGVRIYSISPEIKNGVAKVMLTASIFAMLAGAATTGIGAYEVQVAKLEAASASSMNEAQIAVEENKRTQAKEVLDTLSETDARFSNLVQFIYTHVNDDLSIASVDTLDMLSGDTAGQSTYSEPAEGTEGEAETEGTPEPTIIPYSQQYIDVRGYARNTDIAINFFDSLASEGIAELKVVGIETIELPAGDTIAVFEVLVFPR